MKPYSIDFRKKILKVFQEENLSIRQLAQRFGVAKSFIQKLLKQQQETGDIRPLPQGRGPSPKLNQEHLVNLIEILENQNDVTLEELCHLLEEKTKVRVSRATMGRVIQTLNYSFKKKRYTLKKKKVRKFSFSDLSSGVKFETSQTLT